MVPLGFLVVTTAAGFVVVCGSGGGTGVFVVVATCGAFVGATVGFAVVVGASVGATVGGTVGDTVGDTVVVVSTWGCGSSVPSALAARSNGEDAHHRRKNVAERPISLFFASLPSRSRTWRRTFLSATLLETRV